MGFDRGPVVSGLQDGFVARVGLCGVSGDENGLGYRRIDVLEEREEQRGAAGVANEHGVFVEGVLGQHFWEKRGDGFHVEVGVVRGIDGVAALGQSIAQPWEPKDVRVSTGAVKDDCLAVQGTVLSPIADSLEYACSNMSSIV